MRAVICGKIEKIYIGREKLIDKISKISQLFLVSYSCIFFHHTAADKKQE